MDFHPHPGAGATGLERDTPPYGKPDEELEDDEEEEEVPSPPRSFTKVVHSGLL